MGIIIAPMPFVRKAHAKANGHKNKYNRFFSPSLNINRDNITKKVRVISSIPIFADQIKDQLESNATDETMAAFLE